MPPKPRIEVSQEPTIEPKDILAQDELIIQRFGYLERCQERLNVEITENRKELAGVQAEMEQLRARHKEFRAIIEGWMPSKPATPIEPVGQDGKT